jgi:hypothetical protein
VTPPCRCRRRRRSNADFSPGSRGVETSPTTTVHPRPRDLLPSLSLMPCLGRSGFRWAPQRRNDATTQPAVLLSSSYLAAQRRPTDRVILAVARAWGQRYNWDRRWTLGASDGRARVREDGGRCFDSGTVWARGEVGSGAEAEGMGAIGGRERARGELGGWEKQTGSKFRNQGERAARSESLSRCSLGLGGPAHLPICPTTSRLSVGGNSPRLHLRGGARRETPPEPGWWEATGPTGTAGWPLSQLLEAGPGSGFSNLEVIPASANEPVRKGPSITGESVSGPGQERSNAMRGVGVAA